MALQFINKSPEPKLMQMLGTKPLQSDGWVAIHFHLSELLDEYKSEYQIKIAINLINDLLKNYEGSIFLFSDYSIMVLCFRLEQTIKEKLTFQLRYLYMDDPLAYTDSGQENPKFCTLYELRRDWNEFYALCSHRMVMTTRKIPPAIELPPPAPVVAHPPQESSWANLKSPSALVAPKLAVIEDSLRTVNIEHIIRRQPICAVLPDMKIRRVFDEIYINISHLRSIVKSDIDFFGNRWLFKYITPILDERMLDLIRSRRGQFLESPISINLNVETLLSTRFAEFDASVTPANKIAIIIEVPIADVFVDMAAFTLARTEAQNLGYRVCLDGVTTASLPSINREKLGFDLVKMQWNADKRLDLESDQSKALRDAVAATGTNRLILCRCDNKSAVEYGNALGISLYQGRYLDSLLNPTSKVEN